MHLKKSHIWSKGDPLITDDYLAQWTVFSEQYLAAI